MAIVSVSSHLSSTRFDCSIFFSPEKYVKFNGDKSCNWYFHISSDTFLFKSLLCLYLKSKNFWALVRSNDFLKCKVILRSSLLSSVKIFDGSSECIVFQNLVPKVNMQQLSFQAFINQLQKLLILKKDAST